MDPGMFRAEPETTKAREARACVKYGRHSCDSSIRARRDNPFRPLDVAVAGLEFGLKTDFEMG